MDYGIDTLEIILELLLRVVLAALNLNRLIIIIIVELVVIVVVIRILIALVIISIIIQNCSRSRRRTNTIKNSVNVDCGQPRVGRSMVGWWLHGGLVDHRAQRRRGRLPRALSPRRRVAPR